MGHPVKPNSAQDDSKNRQREKLAVDPPFARKKRRMGHPARHLGHPPGKEEADSFAALRNDKQWPLRRGERTTAPSGISLRSNIRSTLEAAVEVTLVVRSAAFAAIAS